MSKKLGKLKKDARSKYQSISWPPFDMQEPKTQYVYRPELQQKIIYISNMNDGFIRALAGHIIEAEIGSPYTNEQISEWLKEHQIYNDYDLIQLTIDTDEDN